MATAKKKGKPKINIKPSREGSLRAKTKTPKGKNIPRAELEKLAKSKDANTRKKAQFALNARGWKK